MYDFLCPGGLDRVYIIRTHKGQKNKDESTNNDLQNIT
jgi:hypothetical protein